MMMNVGLTPLQIEEWLYTLLIIVYCGTVLSCIVIILSENRNPIKSLAWVTVLLFLPVVGLVFYIFFGRNIKHNRRIVRRRRRKLLHSFPARRRELRNLELSTNAKQTVRLGDATEGMPLTVGNSIEVFTSGEEKFSSLKRDLRNAKRYIYLQYYIFTDDHIGHEIADILKGKVREGVKVRVLYDHVGSFSVKTQFYKKMRRAGIDAQPFMRVTFPQLASRLNWRNHRKIVVIDGEIGYIGGMNIADRYVHSGNEGGAWRDTHFRVRGEVLNSLLYSFVKDWSYSDGGREEVESLQGKEEVENKIAMQLVTSGPDSRWSAIAFAFQRAIAGARKLVYIQTPYFLPTDALLKQLEVAALAGLDVRIMLPERSDSRLLDYASFSYIEECLEAGIKIYLYRGRMIHSKVLIVDDDLVSGGSTNFDFRSFEHNFEANVFVYDKVFNRKMRNVFFGDVGNCVKLTRARWSRRARLQRVLESIVRLMSPIL